jgi:3-oxoacyl-[acyl-carrier protein] reductase
MDLGLADKRALVLGSTKGIGRGIAAVLAAEGARVAITGRDAAVAQATASEIARETGAKVAGYGADLIDAAQASALGDAVASDMGGIDIMVNNGGGPPPGGVAGVGDDVWSAQFQSMFLSQVALTNAFLPAMRERGWGRVLVTSSSGAVQPIPHLGISNTIRGSILNWAKSLAGEVAADGVTVNTILPGRIKTARVDRIDVAAAEKQGKSVDEIVAASKTTIPAGRYGTVEEYAAVAVFLLSAQASYLTGSVIRVDGGFIRAT